MCTGGAYDARAMRAAILQEYGATPVRRRVRRARGRAVVVDVLAAGLNPIDLRIASGTLAARRARAAERRRLGGHRPHRRRAARVLRLERGVAGRARRGPPQERSRSPTAVDDAARDRLRDRRAGGVARARQARLGRGRDACSCSAPAGPVGAIAVQLARLRGAGRVVAASRRPVRWTRRRRDARPGRLRATSSSTS